MLSATDLGWLRAATGRLATDTAQVLTAGEVRTAGGSHPVYTAGPPGWAADLRPGSGKPVEVTAEGVVVAVEQWSIRLTLPAPAGAALPGKKDRLVLGGAPFPTGTVVSDTAQRAAGGRLFEIVGVPTRLSREISRRLSATEIT